jgi:hypothetical protein
MPVAAAGPLGVLAHPGGRYLYVLLRKRLQIAVFEVVGGERAMDLRYTNTTISLVPNGGLETLMAVHADYNRDHSQVLPSRRNVPQRRRADPLRNCQIPTAQA